MALPILSLIVSACGKQNAQANANDPNVPAVVKAPPVVLASDTAKKVVPPTVVGVQEARSTIAANYALLGAAISFGDQKMIAAQYTPDAKLTTSGGTFTGSVPIVRAYKALAGLKSFQRNPRVTSVRDSIVSDSGNYVIVFKRAGADSSFERGVYAAVWHTYPAPKDWLMLTDHLYPATASKKAK